MHIACHLPLFMLALCAAPGLARDPLPADPVLVLGALHDLHAREAAFDHARLRAIVEDFAPDVLVLEVRPDELAERKPTPGRPEYAEVIWPLLDRTRTAAVAMEPGGERFEAISKEANAAFDILRKSNPEGAAALSRLESATKDVLLAYWTAPSETQDERTAAIADGLAAAQRALAGARFASAQDDWDGYMAGRAAQAVQANPGRRVLVVGSYRNRKVLQAAVSEVAPQRLVRPSD